MLQLWWYDTGEAKRRCSCICKPFLTYSSAVSSSAFLIPCIWSKKLLPLSSNSSCFLHNFIYEIRNKHWFCRSLSVDVSKTIRWFFPMAWWGVQVYWLCLNTSVKFSFCFIEGNIHLECEGISAWIPQVKFSVNSVFLNWIFHTK